MNMTTDASEALPGEPKTRVFISYSRKDTDFVVRLGAALRARGCETFVDRADIYPFEDWWQRLQGLIAKAHTIVFVLSPDAIASSVCLKEVDFAASLNKRFAPIVCRPLNAASVPEALRRLNFIDFDDAARFDESVDRLTAALTIDIEWIRKHAEFGEAAMRWSLAGRPARSLLGEGALDEAEPWIAARPQDAPAPTKETQDLFIASRRALTRRRNVVTGALAAGLLIALTLGGFAGTQWWIADRQTKRANQNFLAAKSAADDLVVGFARNLRNVRGISQEMTFLVLNPAKEVMNKLVADSNNNPELLLSRIVLFEEFSKTFWLVGDIVDARDYVKQSLEFTNALIGSQEYSQRPLRILQYRCEDLLLQGDIMRVQGELDASLQSFQTARAVAEQIIKLKPVEDKQAWRQWVSARGRIGDVMRTAERFADAAEEYTAGESVQRRFLAQSPQDKDWLSDLSWTHNRLGDNFLRITNHEGLMTVSADLQPIFKGSRDAIAALGHYESSTRIRSELVQADRTNNERRRDLIWSEALLGMALLASDTQRARSVLEDGLRQVTQLSNTDDKNTEWLRYRALIQNFLGDALLLEGRRPEAMAQYEEGLSVRQKLADTDPRNARWTRDLSYTLERMYELNRIVGDDERARHFRELAIQAGERALRAFPTDAILARAVAHWAQEQNRRASAQH
jgi:tetratricopeptide (TPR) repeat protein